MKVLMVDKFPDKRVAQIKERGFEVAYEPKVKDELAQKVKGVQVLVVRSTKVTAAVIEAADALKLIIRAGSGTDNIDKEAASKRRIAVNNCPGKNAVAVAELTMGLLLSLDRRLPDNVSDLRAGRWNKAEYSKAQGLKGKTLGLIGLGYIGKEVARRARAFDMTVLASDPFLKPEQAAEAGVELVSLEALQARADVLSLHAPATAETKGLLNAAFLAKLKPGAFIINCARADLVDHAALAAAVKEKGLRYATDVPPAEPKDKEGAYSNELVGLPGVYGTHHIGASTEQAQDAVAEEVLHILETYRKDGTVLYQVNKF